MELADSPISGNIKGHVGWGALSNLIHLKMSLLSGGIGLDDI